MNPAESKVPNVGGFLLGAPKCGTSWLSDALAQHPGISVSNPKEPNIVATHKGTFGRSNIEPDWSNYANCFQGNGLKIDCSVHAFACPIAPKRIFENWPNSKFIICLREPVSRTVSHWNMILDTNEDKENGEDWSDFKLAWEDPRLNCDTLYGASVSRWLEYFEKESLLIIEAHRLRHEPLVVLNEVCEHLGVSSHSFDLGAVHNTNSASDRRPITLLGQFFRFAASLLPNFIKGRIVKKLQARGTNVYKMPILSSEAPPKREISEREREILAPEVNADLSILEDLVGFDASKWRIK